MGLLLALSTAAQARPVVHISEPQEPGLADPLLPVSPAGGAHYLATDGQNWLAVYDGHLLSHPVTTGRLLGPDGQPLSTPFAIAYGLEPSAVVFDGHDYLVLGYQNTGPSFVRVTPAGTTTGDVTLLSYLPQPFVLAAAGASDGHALAVVCSASGVCQPLDITQGRVRARPSLPVKSVNQVVYSGGRWLLLSNGPGIVFEVTMLQLDETGYLVDGTLKSLGETANPMSAAPAAAGFALARTAWPQAELLTIDAEGVTTVKGKYGADGDFVTPRNLVRTSDGYLLLAQHFDPAATQEDLLQLFDTDLAPVGDPLELPATSKAILAEAAPGKMLMTWVGSSLKSRLIDLSLPLSSGEVTEISVAPQGQRDVFVSPAPKGWLALWAADRWQYALLDEDGALSSKPKTIGVPVVHAVTRGPGGWLVSYDTCVYQDFDEDDTPCSLELQLIPDSGEPRRLEAIGPMSFADRLTTGSTFSVTGSEQGWLVVWSATDKLHASRLDETGSVVGDSILANKQAGRPAVASAVNADGYRAFWWNAANGKIFSAQVAATGEASASTAEVVGERAELSELASACSGDNFWLAGEAVCREPACLVGSAAQPVTRAWFQADQAGQQALATDSFGTLVSVGGVALGVLSDSHASPMPPIQLGLAEAGAPFEVVRSFEGGASPALASKSNGRALLAFLHASVADGPPVARIVTSVITVTPEEQGGAAGAAGESGAAGGGGADSDPAGEAGQGGDPSTGVDGGADSGQAGADSSGEARAHSQTKGCHCNTAPQRGSSLGLLVPLAWLLRRRRATPAASAKTARG